MTFFYTLLNTAGKGTLLQGQEHILRAGAQSTYLNTARQSTQQSTTAPASSVSVFLFPPSSSHVLSPQRLTSLSSVPVLTPPLHLGCVPPSRIVGGWRARDRLTEGANASQPRAVKVLGLTSHIQVQNASKSCHR